MLSLINYSSNIIFLFFLFQDGKSVQPSHSNITAPQIATQQAIDSAGQAPHNSTPGIKNTQLATDGRNQQAEAEVREKKPATNPARAKKNIILKSKASDSGWTGAGFDVDGRT